MPVCKASMTNVKTSQFDIGPLHWPHRPCSYDRFHRVQLLGKGSGVPAQVSSTSLDHGSKLRGPSPKALVSRTVQRDGSDYCYEDLDIPQNSTTVVDLANKWQYQGSEMSSWVHRNTFSRRRVAGRDSDQRSTVQSVAHESLYHHVPTEDYVRQSHRVMYMELAID
ncbi:hypothetical protein TNCV_3478041 [Trichonephila clavipes]|nr:hypothetical protein TNCV_3478041 [Trichonephila clavipes]